MAGLSEQVTVVDRIGPKKAHLLEKLGIHTLRDALQVYPREYEDRTHIRPIASLVEGERCAVRAIVGTAPVLNRIRRGMEITRLTVFDETGTLHITYFNNKYTAALLRVGEEYLFFGRIQAERNHFVMLSPAQEKILPGQETVGRIVPIYPLTAGVSQHDMERVTAAALQRISDDFPDPLPTFLRKKYNFAPLSKALTAIHRPQSPEEAQQAGRRMVFEELLLLSCGLGRLRERRTREPGLVFSCTDLTAYWSLLGFAPTDAQKRAVQEIVQDCSSGRPMNRLVQGDVGSGKTAVAAALCVLAAQNGYQAALMVPTEILAAQHYNALRPLFHRLKIASALLTGSTKTADRNEILPRLQSGAIRVVIGTHALIQKDVVFHALGAVIADEQHRFGVAQRGALSAKGEQPHVLVMSATPIPRTLALILYGDLDVSVLDELPPGRTPVQTFAVGEAMRARITRFIEKQCAEGGQVYVVCPLVEEGDTDLKSAQQHVQDLQHALPQQRIGLLHGRMKNSEKDAVMRAFAAHTLDILVATTVIEVGVNVPNATLMVVEDADRFGLSQLHQLRGRVGRGARASYCIFFGADKGESARQRLATLCGTNDGFAIARADLEQRGPGDFFGKRQHGLPLLHVADLAGDMAVLQKAQEEASALLTESPDLALYPLLRERVQRMFCEQEGDIFN